MTSRKRTELILRSTFVLITLIIVTTSAFQLPRDEDEPLGRALRLETSVAAADTAMWPLPDKGTGIITYILRNYKRWKAEFKKNPLKWLQLKRNLKRFLTFGDKKSLKKLDEGKQTR